jgi:hypothetical protein
MSLSKRSDIKNHLSTRSGQSRHIKLVQPEDVANPGTADPIIAGDAVEVPNSPLHPIGTEPVANAQVGGSVGVPVDKPWHPRKL